MTNMSSKINQHIGDALLLIPTLNEVFDMIFIDAKKSEYYSYLTLSECLLKPGGVVVADNVKRFANNVQNYLEYVRDSGKYRSRNVDFGFDAAEISIKQF
jgi:predicted O-methyltransferase YrrM